MTISIEAKISKTHPVMAISKVVQLNQEETRRKEEEEEEEEEEEGGNTGLTTPYISGGPETIA